MELFRNHNMNLHSATYMHQCAQLVCNTLTHP